MIIDCSELWLEIRKQIAYDRELIGSLNWDVKLPHIIVYSRVAISYFKE
jgi:hypothetical protein